MYTLAFDPHSFHSRVSLIHLMATKHLSGVNIHPVLEQGSTKLKMSPLNFYHLRFDNTSCTLILSLLGPVLIIVVLQVILGGAVCEVRRYSSSSMYKS